MTVGAGIRLVVVDDHPVVREGIRRLLALDERISEVVEAGSAEEALEQVGACPAHVVLMDIRLPGMDGIEATRQLRSRHPGVKVVVLTCFGDEYLVQAIEAGATGYILKTAMGPELVRAVLQAANGQTAIDPTLMQDLILRMFEVSRMARAEVLSNRQREILRPVADGVPTKGIAAHLSISQATLTRQLRHIHDQLGVDDRSHAVAEAYRRNLL